LAGVRRSGVSDLWRAQTSIAGAGLAVGARGRCGGGDRIAIVDHGEVRFDLHGPIAWRDRARCFRFEFGSRCEPIVVAAGAMQPRPTQRSNARIAISSSETSSANHRYCE